MALQSLSRAASLGQLARVTANAVNAPAPGVYSSMIYFCSLNLINTRMIAGSNWAGSGREPLSCAGAIFGPAHQLLHVQAAPGQRRPDEDIFRTWR